MDFNAIFNNISFISWQSVLYFIYIIMAVSFIEGGSQFYIMAVSFIEGGNQSTSKQSWTFQLLKDIDQSTRRKSPTC
jgi:hypothetical protein